MLELTGDDPLSPASWTKRRIRFWDRFDLRCWSFLFRSIFRWWHGGTFIMLRDRNPGWRRYVFAQPMKVGSRGLPVLGSPVDSNTIMLRPSGSKQHVQPTSMDDYEYFGHHQMLRATPDSIRLGVQPNAPINTYRSGEKVVFSGAVSGDFEVGVTMQFHDGASSRDAGILFRTTGPPLVTMYCAVTFIARATNNLLILVKWMA